MAARSLPVDRRLMLRIEKDASGCWLWTGAINHGGYGSAWCDGRSWLAHRLSYATFVGPIPDGLSVDHLCFVPRCINPSHLRLLTVSENAQNLRTALSDRCKRGHLFDAENTMWQKDYAKPERGLHRLCRACRQASQDRRNARRRVAPVSS